MRRFPHTKSHVSSHIPNRHHRTSLTVCSHLIIPRSWVRSPPALQVDVLVAHESNLGIAIRVAADSGG